MLLSVVGPIEHLYHFEINPFEVTQESDRSIADVFHSLHSYEWMLSNYCLLLFFAAGDFG